jgi:hypothetical protein
MTTMGETMMMMTMMGEAMMMTATINALTMPSIS